MSDNKSALLEALLGDIVDDIKNFHPCRFL